MRRVYGAAAALSRVGGAASLALVLAAGIVTVADIGLRSVTGRGILGTTDIIQLLIMAAAFCAIPYGFFADSHVAVDLLMGGLSPRAVAAIKAVSALLGAAVLAGIAYFGGHQAVIEAGYGDKSSTIDIPKTYYWIWLVGGCAASAAAAVTVALRQLILAGGGPDIAGPE
jgi:TRAP-type C4-dicarboxylate transport system permease small subunit